jgi:hypothetical protein
LTGNLLERRCRVKKDIKGSMPVSSKAIYRACKVAFVGVIWFYSCPFFSMPMIVVFKVEKYSENGILLFLAMSVIIWGVILYTIVSLALSWGIKRMRTYSL